MFFHIKIFLLCIFLHLNIAYTLAQDTVFQKTDTPDFSIPVETFRIIKLSTSINTLADEYWPAITADEQQLFFTRQTGKGVFRQEDFYMSERTKKGWEKAVPLNEINSDENEGAQSISADGRFLVFTACGRRDGYGSCDLYYTRKFGDTWINPQNMGNTINTKAWETQPSLSTDGRTLFFVSNRKGGKGRMDIWVTHLLGFAMNGMMIWSKPENLSINTPHDEMSPFIHANGKSLFFASLGYSGLGGFDLFVTEILEDNSFSLPRNLGEPINTSADEMSFVVNISGNKAYFASARGEENNKDIYSIEIPKKHRPDAVQYVKGRVLDADSLQPIFAQLELVDTTAENRSQFYISDVQSGQYLLCLIEGKNYFLNVTAEGYMYYAEMISTENTQNHSPKNILLKPIAKGEKVTLNHIFFDFDSYKLKDASVMELERLIAFLKYHQQINIQISGHTDRIGSKAYNLKLSECRAESVYDYLTIHGINETRLQYKGYGNSQPVDTSGTDEARAKNRRTEIVIK